jgi:hypothetical protein
MRLNKCRNQKHLTEWCLSPGTNREFFHLSGDGINNPTHIGKKPPNLPIIFK